LFRHFLLVKIGSIRSMEVPSQIVDCKNLIDFQRLLNKFRLSEDKILFKLNCDLPTNSFKSKRASTVEEICNEIQRKLESTRKQRFDLIERCIKENQTIVNIFRDEQDQSKLREAHNTLRQLKNEYTIEEIIAKQTDKVVQERCRKEVL